MCSCHSILECCVTFSGVKLSIRSFVLFQRLSAMGFDMFYEAFLGLADNCFSDCVSNNFFHNIL